MDKLRQLSYRVDELREGGIESPILNSAIYELGLVALAKENVYLAVKSFKELEDNDNLKRAAELGLKTGNNYDALIAFRILNDGDGLRRCVHECVEREDTSYLDNAIPIDLQEKVYQRFGDFIKSKGFERAVSFDLYKVLNAANELQEQYDLGIGIAKGGLFSTFIFDTIGLPTIVTEAHRRGKGATFSWIDSPEKIDGKRIILFDKDAVTGRTLRRVVREVEKHSPKTIDVFFNHNPANFMGTRLEVVPEQINNVFYPGKMDYSSFYDAIVNLEKRLR